MGDQKFLDHPAFHGVERATHQVLRGLDGHPMVYAWVPGVYEHLELWMQRPNQHSGSLDLHAAVVENKA
jgi:hypothetical protein